MIVHKLPKGQMHIRLYQYLVIFAIIFSHSAHVTAQIMFGLSYSGSTELCPGGSLTITADPLPPGNTYQWHREDYTNTNLSCWSDFEIPGATNASITVSESSVYWCIALDQSGQQSGISLQSVWVTSLDYPGSICHSSPLTFCQPAHTTLYAPGVWFGAGTTGIQWQHNGLDIPNANTYYYDTDSSGTYRCRLFNSCGFIYTDSVVVTAIPKPSASFAISGPLTFCPGGNVTFTLPQQAGSNYEWRRNGVLVGSFYTYTAYVSGAYIAYVTDAFGCSNTSLPTEVHAQPFASVTATGPVTFCNGASVQLTANAAAGFTYQWYKNGIAMNGAVSQNVVAVSTGNYTVTLSGSCGSATSSAISVTVKTLPYASITPAGSTTFCSGGSVVLNAPVASNRTYQWKKGADIIPGATFSSYTATAGGTYKVMVTNTVTGCSKTTGTGITVTVYSSPSASITHQGPTTFCAGDSVQLKTSLSSGWTYQWKRNNLNISNANSNKYQAKTAGFYKVKVTNSHGCTAISSSVQVSVPCREGEASMTETDPHVSVHPNPSSADFVLEIENEKNEPISIKVFDSPGNLILNETTSNSPFIISNSQLSTGIYSAIVVAGENKKVFRLIKTSQN